MFGHLVATEAAEAADAVEALVQHDRLPQVILRLRLAQHKEPLKPPRHSKIIQQVPALNPNYRLTGPDLPAFPGHTAVQYIGTQGKKDHLAP